MLDGVFDPFSLYNYCSPGPGEHFFAGVAQLVEQLIRNQQVSGSSPLAGLKAKKLARLRAGLFRCTQSNADVPITETETHDFKSAKVRSAPGGRKIWRDGSLSRLQP